MTSNSAALTTIAQARPGNASAAGRDLLAVLRRIESAVTAETDGLRGNAGFDIAASNARKNRHLFDLSRAVRGVAPDQLDESHREGLESLRRTLAENESALKAHMAAVSEIAGLVQTAIEEANADGTYSAAAFATGTAG